MSGEVASQRRHFPACHAVKVTPSGRLASVRCKPSGSLVEGMFALDNALQIMSFSRTVGGDEADDLLQHFCCTRVHASRKHPPTNRNGRDEVHRGDCQLYNMFINC